MDALGIQWRILLAQTISFSIVFFVLWKYAYGPIFSMLEARKQKIADALANAEKIKTGNAEGNIRSRTNRYQGARGRRAGTRADARVAETRSRTARRADDLDCHREDSNGGRPKAPRGRNRETIVRVNVASAL